MGLTHGEVESRPASAIARRRACGECPAPLGLCLSPDADSSPEGFCPGWHVAQVLAFNAPVRSHTLFSSLQCGAAPLQLRVATFNASLNRSLGPTRQRSRRHDQHQAARRPDRPARRAGYSAGQRVRLRAANPTGHASALDRFHNYLAVSQSGQPALNLRYPIYRAVEPRLVSLPATARNRGDFDNNGSVDTTPGDDPRQRQLRLRMVPGRTLRGLFGNIDPNRGHPQLPLQMRKDMRPCDAARQTTTGGAKSSAVVEETTWTSRSS